MAPASLTSRLVDIPAWTLPEHVEISGDSVAWRMRPLPRAIDPMLADRDALEVVREAMRKLRTDVAMLRRHSRALYSRGPLTVDVVDHLQNIASHIHVRLAGRARLLADARSARARARGSRVAMRDALKSRRADAARKGKRRDTASLQHRALLARDEVAVRRIAALLEQEGREAAETADVGGAVGDLFRKSGILAPPACFGPRSVKIELVARLCVHFARTQELLDAMRGAHVVREDCVRAARALADLDRRVVEVTDTHGRVHVQKRGLDLAEARSLADGLVVATDYRRLSVHEHAHRVAARSVLLWTRLFLSPLDVAWHGTSLALQPLFAGLGAALAMSLFRQADGGTLERFTCEGCDARFEYTGEHRRPRGRSPVFCPSCRARGTSRAPSSAREAIVQLLQTRLGWGWDEGRMRSDVAPRLGAGDSFDELLARARRRGKRR